MRALRVEIEPLAYAQTDDAWLSNRRPYAYQSRVYRLTQEALARKKTLCLFLSTPTGSGKTLGSYAYAINHQEPALGVYPTNELIRDQERALRPWLDPSGDYRLLRVDSAQLDDWQTKLELRRHSETLEKLMNWQPTLLTNPDILFYTFFGLYGGPEGLGRRLFTLLGQYRLFIFDEFHLYNVKQMADVAFFAAALQAINPRRGRVFIFASATPESPALSWLRDRLRLPVEIVAGEPSDAPEARTIAHPLQLTLLPADLRRWKGIETLLEHLPELKAFTQAHPQARLVTILDSVAGAIGLAQTLREQFPDRGVGEVHGFSSAQERQTALHQPFTVGTSTIEVGIDFEGEAEKDVLIYEARTAGQFIQRFGRLARHEKRYLHIPNRVVALTPDYVFHFLGSKLNDGQTLSRHELYALIEEAYTKPEAFERYLRLHALAEFHEARWKVQTSFQPDDRPRISAGLEQAIEALTGKTGSQAWGLHRRYKEEEGILAPLLTFRGSGFEAAILDERGSDLGFPAKRYNLMFLLRRGTFIELDDETYLERLEALADCWPEEAARERRYSRLIKRQPEDLLGVYGYFALTDLLDKGRQVWFEVSEDEVRGRHAQVTALSGLELATEPEVRLRRLNRHLRRKQIVAWFVDRHPASIKLGRALPPLFEIFELRVRRPGGRLSDKPWSIAFNQDAFFIDSLGWWQERQTDDAIIL
ncbi:MAG TPA: type I-D CRISPR-associated helicase Cas3' [Chloroflexi bacterium]|nr:type I-D CRISPR-associated helicase Cas3' [Chloroflexota bacterium]